MKRTVYTCDSCHTELNSAQVLMITIGGNFAKDLCGDCAERIKKEVHLD